MYEDLISGSLGSPGLLDAATSDVVLRSANSWFATLGVTLRIFINWCISSMQSFSLFLRSEPLLLAVFALLFSGFVVSIFMRIYKSV